MERPTARPLGQFLWAWYLAFEKSRISNQELARKTLMSVSSISKFVNKETSNRSEIKAFTGGWAPPASEARSLWFWVGKVYRECLNLSGFLKEQSPNLEWVIADDRRTGVIDNRQALSGLTRFKGSQSSLLGKYDSVYAIFIPKLLPLTSGGREHGIYHLCYLSLFVTPLIRPVRFARAVKHILVGAPRESLSNANFLKCCALAASFLTIDASIQLTSVTLLTSNSFVDELMRYAFLRVHPDRMVNEILHGIPSIPLDDYHKHMGNQIGTSFARQMNFISPFQSVKPYSFSSEEPRDRAISLRINKLLKSPNLDQALSDSKKLKTAAGSAMLVAINGAGNLVNEHYTDSMIFQVEREVLNRVIATGKKNRFEIVCLYSPHPLHRLNGEAEKIKSVLGTTLVIDESLTTWLAADICISIFSGAAWEAAEFGAKSLIGVRPSDGVFDRCVYSGVSFPREGESFFECIDRTILETQVAPHKDPEERFMRVFGQEVLTDLQGGRLTL